jgi:hypothetical protein
MIWEIINAHDTSTFILSLGVLIIALVQIGQMIASVFNRWNGLIIQKASPLIRMHHALPIKIQRLIGWLPFAFAIVLLTSQLITNATPNARSTFSMIANCLTITVSMLTFFISQSLANLEAKIADTRKFAAGAPERYEEGKRERDRYILE